MPMDIDAFKSVYDKWVEEYEADYRANNFDKAVKNYPLIESDDIPWTPYSGRPSDQTFALATNGGLYLKDSQASFDTESIHGDPSFRELPKTMRTRDVGITHAHYDHGLAEEDINVIFPIQRFVELENEGIIGKLTDTHYSFSYVNDAVTLITKSIPDFISRIKAAKVDVLFLVPV